MIDKWAEDTWKTPSYACLACGYVVDAASHSPLELEPRQPKENDVTICLECSHIMVFKKDLTVREATSDELIEIADDKEVQILLQGMAEWRKSKQWRRKHGRVS